LSVYFDASLIVALFTKDAFTERATAYLSAAKPTPLISDFAAAEFAAVVALRVRTRQLSEGQARLAFTQFDNWIVRHGGLLETISPDIRAAGEFVRRLDLPLRAPDALNLAIARRMHAPIATFDDGMASSARTLRLAVAPL
jgi:predicted nucleic acid-binding protein